MHFLSPFNFALDSANRRICFKICPRFCVFYQKSPLDSANFMKIAESNPSLRDLQSKSWQSTFSP
ncbi:hypothetical protein ACWIUD_01515 [Helicobacter sp. 23-1044]